MADSVDRVFGHALNTVNKIRPGSTKPPAADRLALYGLYKQAMEGDVFSPPPASATMDKKELEKYYAWKSHEGLSRTQAKRRYIEKLIGTMHEYASGTEEARELVGELEFVWDQVRGNVSSGKVSERSSPGTKERSGGYMGESSEGAMFGSRTTGAERDGLTVLSPVSQADEEELELEGDAEEFVDAPVSQVDNDEEQEEAVEAADASYAVVPRPRPAPGSQTDVRWRRRVEKALAKLTTEVAALREQLETRRFFGRQQRYSLWGWMLRLSWWAVQLFVADAVILWFVILYMRRKKDNRLELAVRVLLGDAVAQVQKVGSQVGNQIPRIRPSAKKAG